MLVEALGAVDVFVGIEGSCLSGHWADGFELVMEGLVGSEGLVFVAELDFCEII